MNVETLIGTFQVGKEGDDFESGTEIQSPEKSETGKIVGILTVFLIGGVVGFMANEATKRR